MNRAWKQAAAVSRRNFLAWSAAVGAAGLAGCKTAEPDTSKMPARSQIGEDPADPDTVVTIGSKTSVSNTEALQVNASALVQALIRQKPSTAKGVYLRSITMSSTMGPGACWR